MVVVASDLMPYVVAILAILILVLLRRGVVVQILIVRVIGLSLLIVVTGVIKVVLF